MSNNNNNEDQDEYMSNYSQSYYYNEDSLYNNQNQLPPYEEYTEQYGQYMQQNGEYMQQNEQYMQQYEQYMQQNRQYMQPYGQYIQPYGHNTQDYDQRIEPPRHIAQQPKQVEQTSSPTPQILTAINKSDKKESPPKPKVEKMLETKNILQDIKQIDNVSEKEIEEIDDLSEQIYNDPKIVEILENAKKKPHINIVYVGHVDAGKSTTCGNILCITGEVDDRTIEKYEREAKEKNRESWFLAFVMDVNDEERAKGKTVEVGRATFKTENRRFTILDAPGHKSFVPNMISGAAQADVAVLIVSARKGEFETGFEKGGQTREHALLVKTFGVTTMIVAVNKMDDITCQWDEERYNEIVKKIGVYLKSCGYNLNKDVIFVPISGLSNHNIEFRVTDKRKFVKDAQWYKGPSLLEIFDELQPPARSEKSPLRIPLLEGFKDQGVMASGKIEAGVLVNNTTALLLPSNIKVKIIGVLVNDEDVLAAAPGDNVMIRLTGVDEDQIPKGSLLSSIKKPCPCGTTFRCQIMVVELLETRPILTMGYSCIIHIHTVEDEVTFKILHETIDRTTKKKKTPNL